MVRYEIEVSSAKLLENANKALSVKVLGIYPLKNRHLRLKPLTLADVAQWIECWPVNQKVASSIPSQGTCLDCRPGP